MRYICSLYTMILLGDPVTIDSDRTIFDNSGVHAIQTIAPTPKTMGNICCSCIMSI